MQFLKIYTFNNFNSHERLFYFGLGDVMQSFCHTFRSIFFSRFINIYNFMNFRFKRDNFIRLK